MSLHSFWRQKKSFFSSVSVIGDPKSVTMERMRERFLCWHFIVDLLWSQFSHFLLSVICFSHCQTKRRGDKYLQQNQQYSAISHLNFEEMPTWIHLDPHSGSKILNICLYWFVSDFIFLHTINISLNVYDWFISFVFYPVSISLLHN